jgi:molecular chaperone GrpE
MVKKPKDVNSEPIPSETTDHQHHKEAKSDKTHAKKAKPDSHAELETLKKEMQQKIDEAQDKYLRLSAEFDNYRKRTLREKSDILKSAGEEVIMKILPVIDDFERALSFVDNSKDIEAVKAGIHLIYSKFLEKMTQQGVKEIEALNQVLDTDKHEAVTKIAVEDEKQKGKIVDVLEKGYFLNDKVIRFAKVVIGE